ncbi:MAG TPA: peptidyl-prolyl cis-trans isomerase, partial [Pyrinomonadaceae bacterium]|nr:peptidyl-prolyl cis-trans isomerase [Pyrinomonadaceae bacterium]
QSRFRKFILKAGTARLPISTVLACLTVRRQLLDCAPLMKFFRFAFFLLMFCAAAPLRAELMDGVVAVVNDQVITRQQVQDFAMPAVDALRRQYATDSQEFQQKLNDVLTNSLELLIERQLILRAFDAEGYRMPDSYLDELVQDRIRERFGDRVTLTKTLQAEGMTYEQFCDDVRDQTIESFMRSKKVAQEIVISPFQVEQYYKAHQQDYKVEDQVRLRMIVLNKTGDDDTNTPALAKEIKSELKEGVPFAQLASVYSQGSEAKDGGEKGWIDRTALRKELSDVAFTLKPGDVSDVIETPEACYVLKIEETTPAHVRPISEIREDIEKTLRAQKHDELERQWIESLRKKTFIRIFA